MRLVREGSTNALDQITRCYSDRLLQAGRRHCRTAEEAEDAVQDALITAGESLGSLREDERLEGWLIRVGASACRRLGRGRKNDARLHATAHDDAPDLPLGDEHADPERDAARHELGRVLERTLLTLSPSDRSILLLAELEDFSAAEIAAELDMTAGAVRTRLSRLRTTLTAMLEQELGRAP